MNKPPLTLVDRPARRDWTIWLAGVVVAVAHLWDVVDIYLLDRRIYGVLGAQGSAVTLLAELLLAAMTGTFVVVVLTTSRRAVRNWRYQRYLAQNVTILTSSASGRRGHGDRRRPIPHPPSGAPVSLSAAQSDGMGEALPSPRPRPAPVRLRFNGSEGEASSGAEGSLHGRG